MTSRVRGDGYRLYESQNLTAGGDQDLAVERALASAGKQVRGLIPSRPPTVSDEAGREINDEQGTGTFASESRFV